MKSYVKVIASMLIWGTLPVFVSKIPQSSAEIVMWRILFGIAFLIIIHTLSKSKSPLGDWKGPSPKLMLSGFFMGANWVALFEAYRFVGPSIATLIYYLAPIMVMIASFIIFKENLGPVKIIGTISALIGMFIVTGMGSGGSAPTKGILFAFVAAACYASVTLINKGVKGLNGVERTILQLMGAGLVVIPYAIATHQGAWLNLASEAGIYAVLIGILHSGLALYLYFSSIQELPAQSVALCSYIDPASALFFSAMLLGDALGPVQLVGAVMMLGGAAAGEIFGNKTSKKDC